MLLVQQWCLPKSALRQWLSWHLRRQHCRHSHPHHAVHYRFCYICYHLTCSPQNFTSFNFSIVCTAEASTLHHHYSRTVNKCLGHNLLLIFYSMCMFFFSYIVYSSDFVHRFMKFVKWWTKYIFFLSCGTFFTAFCPLLSFMLYFFRRKWSSKISLDFFSISK